MSGGVVIDALAKTYPGSAEPALDGVSLHIPPGQVVGLLGPNGAGKSSVVGACTTRMLPSAGNVRIDGIDVRAAPVAAKRHLGVVAQHNTLDRSVSAWENLYLHCRYFGLSARQARTRSDQLLETFSLAERPRAPIATLSGGQARRLQLARAIAHRPATLFLDEPTVGLDPQSRHLLWDLISELRHDGVAVLLTTHYMDEADRLCDHLAILDRGRLIAAGTPAELKSSVHADTAITVTVRRDIDALSRQLSQLSAVRSITPGGDRQLRVLVTGGERSVAQVVDAAVRHQLTGVAVEPVSLETVFLTLTGRQLHD